MSELLLTGERGYVGSTLAAVLARQGIPFATLPGRLEGLAPRSLRCRRVIHCAGALAHRPADWQQANVLGTQRLLAALPADAEIVLLSSRSVYDPQAPGPLTEDAPTRPGSGYGQSKLAAEEALRASGRPCLILRVSTLFGVAGHGGLGEFNFPAQALRALVRGEAVPLFTPDRPCDYLEVQALALALAGLARQPLPAQSLYNLAGPPRSLHQLLQTLARLVTARLGQEAKLQHQPGPPPRTAVLDCTCYATALGALQARPDEQVLADMVEAWLGATPPPL